MTNQDNEETMTQAERSAAVGAWLDDSVSAFEQASREQAALALAKVLADVMVLDELAPRLCCHEAEAFAGFLAAWASPEAAEELLRLHALSDEEGDAHA